MHLPSLIQDLAIILGVAGLMSLLFRRIRQPVVLGYILAGMLVGPYTPPIQWVTDLPSIHTWAELGVIFLMFSLGLEFSFRKLARVGVSAGLTASFEVLFFIPLGFLAGRAFGWKTMDCIFLGAMLSISSTTIIIKALDELKLKSRKFSQIIFATLIVEDLFAILILVGLTTLASGGAMSALGLLTTILQLVLVVGSWFIVGYFVVPRFMKYAGRIANGEVLTLLSLGLCLGLVVFAAKFHYPTALGAFIMGSILAESPLHHQIEARLEPLRDVFGAVFFVSIGMLIDPQILWAHKGVIVILCGFTIIGKILSTSLGALVSGQSFKNSVQVGMGLAQIGEFSFIIAGVGITLQVTSDFLSPIIVAVSLVTTFTTPYLIQYSERVAISLETLMPPRWRQLLERYAQKIGEAKPSRPVSGRTSPRVLRWFLNGLMASVVFVIGAQFTTSSRGLAWLFSLVLSSPFIWGMLSTFKNSPAPTLLILILQTLSVVWIGALSAEFFSTRNVWLATLTVLGIFFAIFYRRIEQTYHWLENRFLGTFTDELKHLAPWDAHLVRMKVHPNASLALKKISDSQLRSHYGVNLVAIQRGLKTIVAPKPDERLLPEDEILVLGTDEQLENARTKLEVPAESAPSGPPETLWPLDQAYEVRKFKISERSPLNGKSIRDSTIRENYASMVVGIEHGSERNLNPSSDLQFSVDDTLWIVGEPLQLNRLRNWI